jgi:3-oxoadipate enol-lactonase/4-carboxymuconolactone decarboxylase
MTVPLLRCVIDPADPTNSSSQLLVLGPSLGTSTDLWTPALAALAVSAAGGRARILRFDLPGHGASPVATEPFTIAELADAVLRLVDETGGGRFHYAGVSLSGSIGIELALRHPERLLSLAVFCGDARIGTAQTWTERASQVSASGTPSLVAAMPGRWFAPNFIVREPRIASAILNDLSEVDDSSYVFCCGAMEHFDRSAKVGDIAVPTTIVSGQYDPVTTPSTLQSLAARIPQARYVEFADSSHLAAVEQPSQTAVVLADLLAPTDAHVRGMATRRAVLGDEHVDTAQAMTTSETAPFQEFILRFAWGEIWSRPELSRRERSIATLASLVTGSHENEIAMHVRAALTNGLSRTEIAEVIMHTSLYAGLPSANTALGIMRNLFAELDAKESDG